MHHLKQPLQLQLPSTWGPLVVSKVVPIFWGVGNSLLPGICLDKFCPPRRPRCYWSCQGQSLDPGNPNVLAQLPVLNRPKVKQIGDRKKVATLEEGQ